jgi:nitroreductase
MDDELLYNSIFKRRSVRNFDTDPLDEATVASIRAYISALRPLLPGIRTDVRLLVGEAVKGMFKVSAPYHIAIYSEERDGHLANAGFMLQQLDLFFNASGIGCCWQGMQKPSNKVDTDLKLVILLGFGRPAEPLDRAKADFKRVPLSDITDIKGEDELLEAARLAPSAMNKQSWFFTKDGDMIDVLYGRSMMFDKFNQINSGIALFHLLLAAKHQGRKAEVIVVNDAKSPRGYEYSASLSLS